MKKMMTTKKTKIISVNDFEVPNRVKSALINAGISDTTSLLEKFESDIKALKGLGAQGLAELKVFLTKHKLKLKKKPKEVKDISFHKYIITKFLKAPPTSWGREINVADRLLKTYPNREFWEGYALKYKLNTLVHFLHGDGKSNLIFAYNAPKVKTIEAPVAKPQIEAAEIQGENLITEKPKSIGDFLNQF